MYYVMGGMFGYRPNQKFELVRPTKSELPYVTDDPEDSLFRLCKHHSHLYEVSADGKTLRLRKESFEARDVPAPGSVILTPTQVTDIQRVIAAHKRDLETAADDAMALK